MALTATCVFFIGLSKEAKDPAPASSDVAARDMAAGVGMKSEREPQAVTGHASSHRGAASRSDNCLDAQAGRAYYLTLTERYASRLGVEFHRSREHPHSCARARELAHIAKRKARHFRLMWKSWHDRFTRLYEKWRCIHEHEGAWNANTGNGYYGGLQMTLAFQAAHGPSFVRRWGTANNWPVWAQLQAAEDAWNDDGQSYREWGTAGVCGLA